MKISPTHIIKLEAKGMAYRFKTKKYFVNFASSAVNFDHHRMTSGEWENPLPVKVKNCIGWSDTTAKKPYLEIFSVPRLRIEFSSLFFWQRRHDLTKFQKQLEAHGWRTFELSHETK